MLNLNFIRRSVRPSAALALVALAGGTGCLPAAATTHDRDIPVLTEFASAWHQTMSYTTTVTVLERKTGDAQTRTRVLSLRFERPSRISIRIVSGPNAGASLIWNGGDTVAARRGSGLAGLFSRTLSLHDPMVTSARGSSIDELGFGAILEHLDTFGGEESTSLGKSPDGAPIDTVTLVPQNASANSGLTREVFEFSESSHFPICVLGYAGNDLVRSIEFSDTVVSR